MTLLSPTLRCATFYGTPCIYTPIFDIIIIPEWLCTNKSQKTKKFEKLFQLQAILFLLQVGGFNGSLRVKTVDVYDAAMDTWSSCESMDARRSTLGVAVLNGCIYAVGGFDGSTGLNTAEMYDPQTGKWRQIAIMSTRRSSVGVGVLYGQLYAVSILTYYRSKPMKNWEANRD